MSKNQQNIKLYVSCKNLPDKDILSKSDPFVQVYERVGSSFRLAGQTEKISDDLNPHFSTPIDLCYQFERRQILKFVVNDYDGQGQSDHLGEAEMSLGQLISNCEPGSPGFTQKLKTRGGNNKSTITISAVQVDNGNKIVKMDELTGEDN